MCRNITTNKNISATNNTKIMDAKVNENLHNVRKIDTEL